MITKLLKNLFSKAETEASTAEQNAKNYTDTSIALKGFEVTMNSGQTLLSNQMAVMGRFALGTLQMQVAATRNTWTNIGTVDVKPPTTVQFPLYSLAYGRWSGLLRINSSGGMAVYPFDNTLSSESVGVEIAFFT